MIAKEIQPYVTHFTYQVETADHKSDIVVGGKITAIKQMMPHIGPYLIHIDDQIGETQVTCSHECFAAYQHFLKIGEIILIHGIVNQKQNILHAYRMESLFRRKLV